MPDGDLCRVSLCHGAVQVDLALPIAVPVVSLIPAIMDMLTAGTGHGDDPVAAGYQLSRPGGSTLEASQTLGQNGIRDGEVLLVTRSQAQLPAPGFDDPAEAVSMSLAAARPWTGRGARLTTVVTASWPAGAAAATLMQAGLRSGDAHRVAAAAIAAGIAGVALAAAAFSHRGCRDAVAGRMPALFAVGFAAVAGLLAVPGAPGVPHALLAATAAGVASVIVLQVLDRSATLFVVIAVVASLVAAAALVGTLTAAPLQAVAAVVTVISLGLLEASAPVSILLSGLSPRLGDDDSPSARELLRANAIRADVRLTALVGASSVSAALGAAGAAFGAGRDGASHPRGVALSVLTGVLLLLRARAHRDPTRSASLLVTGMGALSCAFGAAGMAYPAQTPLIATTAAALALALTLPGRRRSPIALSAPARRGVAVLEYAALAGVVPLACWICGLFGAARGMQL
ncbi:type VII secretion integral membrane protein EccD [Mycobacterium sp.]|uniref:type VII secretion integral membrane protein EccD n=1 Tax=Mycobacterium sp. TaxID=1785 RepID=UPI0031DDD6EA